jgi:uncharacterized protein (TIGR03437 family)
VELELKSERPKGIMKKRCSVDALGLSNSRIRILVALSLSAAVSTGARAQQYSISTVAGNGTAGFSGDGGSATSAMLNGPIGVALDAPHNLYVADVNNERIRLVSGGTISTLAGNGTTGYLGDGGAATSAEMYSPTRATVDRSGNVYIADASNDVIRMVPPGGTISTVAGNVCTATETTPCGAGYAGNGGAATAAQLNYPLGVAVDSAGNLYIADSNNNVIREVSGGTISAVFVSVHLNDPIDVAVDSANNLYIADINNNRIVKVTSAGIATVVAGNGTAGFSGDGGPASKAQLSYPTGVAVDGVGNVYIADTLNQRIRKVAPNGTITTIAGTGQQGYAGDGGPASAATFSSPRGITVDPSGTLYVADTGNNVVRMLAPPSPAISADGVVNAASFAPGISPGALGTIFGSNFLAVSASAGLPVPSSLSGVQVSVSGQLAPVLYVSPTQVNFQVPWETATGTANVVLSRNGVLSSPITVPVLLAAPGLFIESSGAAVVQNEDYTLNQPGNPAAAGSVVIAYFTGSGPVSGTITDGFATPASPLLQSTATVAATIGSASAQVLFAGLSPGFVGLAQANIVIPAGTATGTYPLTITIDGQASNAGNISVQ